MYTRPARATPRERRNFLSAVARLCSNRTVVSSPHNRRRMSSSVTTSQGRSSRSVRISHGWRCRGILLRCFQSSPVASDSAEKARTVRIHVKCAAARVHPRASPRSRKGTILDPLRTPGTLHEGIG